MSLDSKKLSLIERFMKFKEERSILQLENAITEIELNNRAEESEKDISTGRTRSYDDFQAEVKKWISSK